MCGIAGVVGPPERAPRSRHEVELMCAALRRRGPDGVSQGTFDGVVLGHARLAIIDLVSGDQPQSSEDGRIVVVVNGEIYNYVELRADLEADGARFRTQSDIEVIPHLWLRHCESFLEHLRGMFAIALLDRRDGTLVLARDRLGKKPLYWTEQQGRFYFASEPKALLAVDALRFTVDPRAVDLFFTYQYVPAPLTVFSEVRKLEAATILRRGADGRMTERRWWTPRHDECPIVDEEEALAAIEEKLVEATRLRLRADVPVGAFLSAGIDSSLVVTTAAAAAQTPLRTTTIVFGDDDEDEARRARRIAKIAGTRHSERRIAAEVRDLLFRVAGFLDEPLGDSSTLPSFLVASATREDVKVALSGDGGDETFGGYAWRYWQNLSIERVRSRLPRAVRAALGCASNLYPKADRLPKPMRLKWGLRNLSVDAQTAYFLDMSIFRPEDKLALYRPEFSRELDDFESRSVIDAAFARCHSPDLLTRLLLVDLQTYLAEGVLAKADRMSMAASLEVRAPLLDHELVELGFRIDPALKMKGRTSKYILRRLAARHVGEEIASAPKRGFAPPLARWLRHDLVEVFREFVLERPQGIDRFLDRARLERLFAEHLSGRRDASRPLWLALTFELWFRNFAKGASGGCAS